MYIYISHYIPLYKSLPWHIPIGWSVKHPHHQPMPSHAGEWPSWGGQRGVLLSKRERCAVQHDAYIHVPGAAVCMIYLYVYAYAYIIYISRFPSIQVLSRYFQVSCFEVRNSNHNPISVRQGLWCSALVAHLHPHWRSNAMFHVTWCLSETSQLSRQQ